MNGRPSRRSRPSLLVNEQLDVGHARRTDNWTSTQGWLVLSGRAYQMESMPPYVPFVEALAQYVRSADDEAVKARLASVAQIAVLLPELQARLVGPESRPKDAASERYLLFESVANVLLEIAGGAEASGLLLCLDDLHWAERSTLLLLLNLARRLGESRLLVLTAVRSEEAAKPPLSEFVAELTRERLATQVFLNRLSQEETAELIQRHAGSPVTGSVAEAIYNQTDGNPFFVEEVVRQLNAEGRDLTNAHALDRGWRVPEGVHQVVEQRLSRLGGETLHVLHAGAVLGDGFSFELVRLVVGLKREDVTPAVEEASHAGILIEEDGAFRFQHPLIRQVLYERLSLPRRQDLHLRAGEAIETIFAANLEPHLSSLAGHFRLARIVAVQTKAEDYLVRAGEQARALFAYDEAASFWQSALELMEQAGRPPRQRASLLGRLGDLMYTTGFDNYVRSQEYCSRALALYEAEGDGPEAAKQHLSLARVFSSSAPTQDLQRALVHLQAAEKLQPGDAPSRAQLSLQIGLAAVLTWQVHTEDGLKHSRIALELAEQLGNEASWISACAHQMFHLIASGRIAAAFELIDRASAAADRVDQTMAGFMYAAWSGGRCFYLCDPVRGQAIFEGEIKHPRQAGAAMRRRALVSDLATSAALAGDLDRVRHLLEEIGDDVLDQEAACYARPMYAFWSGDLAVAERLWQEAAAHHKKSGNRWSRATFELWLARLARIKGNDDEAERRLEWALGVASEGPHLPLTLWAGCDLIVLYAGQRRLAEALALLERCREIVSNGEDWRGLLGRFALADGAFAAASGNPEQAETCFEEALEVFRSYSLVWDQAEALRVWGEVLARSLRRRSRDKASEKLTAAAEIYRSHEAGECWINLVVLAAEHFLPHSVASRHLYPDQLTQREVEVIRLIAAGKSNREIADALVLSLRTVERHMSNAYDKAGVHTKAQATAYAIQHDLA